MSSTLSTTQTCIQINKHSISQSGSQSTNPSIHQHLGVAASRHTHPNSIESIKLTIPQHSPAHHYANSHTSTLTPVVNPPANQQPENVPRMSPDPQPRMTGGPPSTIIQPPYPCPTKCRLLAVGSNPQYAATRSCANYTFNSSSGTLL